jgi:hypothetical protein
VRYRKISWWPQAYHVFNDEKRLGIVSAQTLQRNGYDQTRWFAHTASMVGIGGDYKTRHAAAEALPTKHVQMKGKTLRKTYY